MVNKKEKYAFLLIYIENWEILKETLSTKELAYMESQFLDYLQIKFGDSFCSLIVNEGEFFISVNQDLGDKSILKFSGELKHQIKLGTKFLSQKLPVSIAITTRAKDRNNYAILMHLRKVLLLCRSNSQEEVLCVA